MAVKLLIGMPSRDGRLSKATMRAVDTAVAVAGVPADYCTPTGFNITTARNQCVRELLAGDYTHLLFHDDDVIAPEHAFKALLELPADIASACVPFAQGNRIVPNVLPAEWSAPEWPSKWPRGVIGIRRCGLGCCLIKRHVFEALKHPWFTWLESEDGRELGEDLHFADKAREAGFTLKADGDVRCGHFGRLNLLPLCGDTGRRERKALRVVSHARSGTGYMAALLNLYGYDVGHERMGADGISSWMFAAEHVTSIPYRGDRATPCNYEFENTVHLVRSPLDTIASVAEHECSGTGDLAGHRTEKGKCEVEDFRARHCLICMGDPPLVRAAQSWLGWNRLCESLNPDVRIRVEDAPTQLDEWLQSVGPLARPRYGDLPPTDVNAIPHEPLTWEQLREQLPRPLYAELIRMAGDYGYEYNGA